MFVQRIIAAAFAVALALFVWWGASRLVAMQREEERAARAALVKDTLEAARDTTRAVRLIGTGGKSLFDSLRVVERRAVQTAQQADALDRALKSERVVRDRLEATIADLRSSAVAETVFVADGASVGGAAASVRVLRATFDVRQAPYRVQADVTLAEPPARGRMDVRVALDTLGLELRVGCGAAGPEGVRPASVSVAGPSWASVRLGRVDQAPGVCAPGVNSREGTTRSVLRRFVERFGLTVGYAAARTPSGTVVAGPAVGVGFRVWP